MRETVGLGITGGNGKLGWSRARSVEEGLTILFERREGKRPAKFCWETSRSFTCRSRAPAFSECWPMDHEVKFCNSNLSSSVDGQAHLGAAAREGILHPNRRGE